MKNIKPPTAGINLVGPKEAHVQFVSEAQQYVLEILRKEYPGLELKIIRQPNGERVIRLTVPPFPEGDLLTFPADFLQRWTEMLQSKEGMDD